uniref:Carboxyl-terminal-processing protease n=1 Tax=Cyanothece sp. (strain PCC 7425 / ATCC 29141) TaxID=395961 RepID=B8HWC5_CYAP4
MRKQRIALGLLLVVVLQFVSFCWLTPIAHALTEEQKLYLEAWRIVSQAYVDPSFNGENWWLVRQKALQQPLDDREATYTAIQEMLAHLGDPFTRLLKPAQYHNLQTTTTGELTGIGLQISTDPATGLLEVITPIEGSPAAKAGLQPHDQILLIDGISTKELSLDEAAERMRGPIGSTVSLTIRHPQNQSDSQEIQLIRDRIALNPVQSELRQTESGKLGYIRLNQFNANATEQMTQAIRELEKQGADRYILDLRGNPGGLLQAGIEIAQQWLEPGNSIVYTVDRQGIMGSFSADRAPLTTDPLVVLVNGGTASASEILAGALQDTGRAKLVGEKTFGKGSIQSLFNLSDGAGLAVTIAHYETPNHHDINKVGIQPDVVVPLTPLSLGQVGSAADSQYQAAVQLLHPSPG